MLRRNTLLHLIFVELSPMLLFQFALQDFLKGIAVDYFESTRAIGENNGCLAQAAYELIWTFESRYSRTYCFQYDWRRRAFVLPVVNWIYFVLVSGLWLIPVVSFIRKFGVWTSKVNTGHYLHFMFRVRQDVRYRRLCLLIESLALLTTICLLVFAWMLGV